MKEIPVGDYHTAIVDDEDFERVSAIQWMAIKRKHTVYARGYILHEGWWQFMYMHRFVMQTPRNLVTDHINRNGLDNRRSNLRNVTHTVNARNTIRSQDRDDIAVHVHWYKYRNKWRTTVGRTYIGLFETKEEAIKARDEFIASSLVANST